MLLPPFFSVVFFACLPVDAADEPLLSPTVISTRLYLYKHNTVVKVNDIKAANNFVATLITS
jgi:hypothetical protein